MSGISAGGNLFISVDLVRFGTHAIFLAGKLTLDSYGNSLSLIGATGILGFRY
jgi:hypothetical protein